MKLFLVRHGETYENEKNLSQGHLDTKLNAKGIEQTKKIAFALKNENIDVAYSSDLSRAKDTLNEILKFHPKTKVHFNKILREQNKGLFQGKENNLIKQELQRLQIPYEQFVFPKGESLIDVWNKVVPLFETITNANQKKNVLIVSHGGPIHCIVNNLQNKSVGENDRTVKIKNTSLTIVNLVKEKIIFEKIFCDKHLEN